LPTIRVWCGADADRQGQKPSLRQHSRHAGGAVATDAWWVGENGPTGFHLSDAAIDWIEEVANGETPERSAGS